MLIRMARSVLQWIGLPRTPKQLGTVLQRCIVCGRKTAIFGECRNRSIGEIPRNEAANLVQFLNAGRVRMHLIVLKKFRPTHAMCPSAGESCPVKLNQQNDL